MLDIDNLLDQAKSNSGLASDRAIGRHLEVNQSLVAHWRKGSAFPNDNVIVELADLAGIPSKLVLMSINAYKTRGRAREVYLEILQETQETPSQ